jgi:magnesium transporter
MKLLTSITIILSLPTMVSSFFGMNVKVPFEGEAQGFVIVLIICLTLSCALAFVFWKKRYF